MVKYIILIILITTTVINASSQKNEYRYFSFKLGIIHNFIHPQPINPIDNYILGSDNQLHQFYSVKNILYDYSASFGMDFLYHFDFVNDKMGIVTGIGYQTKKYRFEYSTDYLSFNIVDKYNAYEIGIPLLFKFGNGIWKRLRFYYFGSRFGYILSAKDKNNFQSNSEYRLERNELKPIKVSILAGFNYCIYNFEIEYQINSIFNKSFQNSAGNSIYSNQKGNFVFLKTFIHICPRYYSYGYTSCFPHRKRRIIADPFR